MSRDLELFLEYQRLRSEDARQLFALRHPRLLWIKTVRALSGLAAAAPPTGALSRLANVFGRREPNDTGIRIERLVELDRFRLSFRTTDDYPLGPGPVEEIATSPAGLGERLASVLAARTLDIVAPPYLRSVAYHGEDLVLSGDLDGGLTVARLAAESALALADRDEIDIETFDAVIAFVQASIFHMSQRFDASVRHHALSAARRAIARAEECDATEALGRLYQALGALHSDIWTVAGVPYEPGEVELARLMGRLPTARQIFEMPSNPEPWLDALNSLQRSLVFYRRAVPYRTGAARGLTYKAMVQTADIIQLAFGVEPDGREMQGLCGLAAELLSKQSQRDYHMQTLLSVAERRHWSIAPPMDAISEEAAELLELIGDAYDPGVEGESETERRRQSHAAAVADLRRALRHGLQWGLYLRNFDFANEIRRVGETIAERNDKGELRIVMPDVTYSIVDHKVLELFGEGVVTICDPGLSTSHLLSTVPMLSLRNDAWLPVVRRLAAESRRIVLLLDAVTPGVEQELRMLRDIEAAPRTLVVLGDTFRHGATVSEKVTEAFPHRVDWLDFSHDERHFDMRHKAHRMIQKELARFVHSDARQTVNGWLGQSRR